MTDTAARPSPVEVLVDSRSNLAHAKAGTVPDRRHRRSGTGLQLSRPRALAGAEMRTGCSSASPLVLGFSCEFTEPNAWKAMEVAGTPILLIVRNADGEIRSFVNMCSHRGAQSWSSRRARQRPAASCARTTPGTTTATARWSASSIATSSARSTSTATASHRYRSRSGPGSSSSVSPRTARSTSTPGCAATTNMLAFHHFDDCHFVGSPERRGPNWKVAYDGYLDFYHLPILHKNTFGPTTPTRRSTTPGVRTSGSRARSSDAEARRPPGRTTGPTTCSPRRVDDLPAHLDRRLRRGRPTASTPAAVGCTWSPHCSPATRPTRR